MSTARTPTVPTRGTAGHPPGSPELRLPRQRDLAPPSQVRSTLRTAHAQTHSPPGLHFPACKTIPAIAFWYQRLPHNTPDQTTPHHTTPHHTTPHHTTPHHTTPHHTTPHHTTPHHTTPAVYCGSSTAHCPQAVRQCIAGVPLPTAPPPGSGAVYCGSCTVHCPQAVGQCIAGDPLPPAPGPWRSVPQEFH